MKHLLKVELFRYNKATFDRGATRCKEVFWVLARLLFFQSSLPWPSQWRVYILRAFGAVVGQGVVIRSRVNVWMPWRLEIQDHVWIGEEACILNLAPVSIGSNVCLSQRVFLCTGNHDYKSSTFDLSVKPIVIEDGAWIAGACFVGPGVRVGSHAVLAAGSVATKDLAPFGVYQGNPAVKIRNRISR